MILSGTSAPETKMHTVESRGSANTLRGAYSGLLDELAEQTQPSHGAGQQKPQRSGPYKYAIRGEGGALPTVGQGMGQSGSLGASGSNATEVNKGMGNLVPTLLGLGLATQVLSNEFLEGQGAMQDVVKGVTSFGIQFGSVSTLLGSDAFKNIKDFRDKTIGKMRGGSKLVSLNQGLEKK